LRLKSSPSPQASSARKVSALAAKLPAEGDRVAADLGHQIEPLADQDGLLFERVIGQMLALAVGAGKGSGRSSSDHSGVQMQLNIRGRPRGSGRRWSPDVDAKARGKQRLDEEHAFRPLRSRISRVFGSA
jgi:hypothetical protein